MTEVTPCLVVLAQDLVDLEEFSTIVVEVLEDLAKSEMALDPSLEASIRIMLVSILATICLVLDLLVVEVAQEASPPLEETLAETDSMEIVSLTTE